MNYLADMEVLYLAEAKRISLPLDELLRLIGRSTNYAIVPVDESVVESATAIDDVPELHDRILAGTAVLYGVPIITPDHVLTASRHVETIWL